MHFRMRRKIYVVQLFLQLLGTRGEVFSNLTASENYFDMFAKHRVGNQEARRPSLT